jgi:hypothetical protein
LRRKWQRYVDRSCGHGRRPRLRFDPAIVAQQPLAEAPAMPSAPPARFIRRDPDVPLLPIRGRALGGEERAEQAWE